MWNSIQLSVGSARVLTNRLDHPALPPQVRLWGAGPDVERPGLKLLFLCGGLQASLSIWLLNIYPWYKCSWCTTGNSEMTPCPLLSSHISVCQVEEWTSLQEKCTGLTLGDFSNRSTNPTIRKQWTSKKKFWTQLKYLLCYQVKWVCTLSQPLKYEGCWLPASIHRSCFQEVEVGRVSLMSCAIWRNFYSFNSFF